MKTAIQSLIFGFILMAFGASTVDAQIGIIWSVEPPETSNPFLFLGAENMDNDPGDELVYKATNRIIIYDGETGTVDWDSGVWNAIYIAGHEYYYGSGADLTYGNSPFCDIDGDDIYEITFFGRQSLGDLSKNFVIGFSIINGLNDDRESDDIPENYELAQNYPNPFNPSTSIEYCVSKRSHVKLNIYNSLGQLVKVLVNEEKPAGDYTVNWDGIGKDGRDLASGVYFYTLKTETESESKKMVLLK